MKVASIDLFSLNKLPQGFLPQTQVFVCLSTVAEQVERK
jgi:hypothetical protein